MASLIIFVRLIDPSIDRCFGLNLIIPTFFRLGCGRMWLFGPKVLEIVSRVGAFTVCLGIAV